MRVNRDALMEHNGGVFLDKGEVTDKGLFFHQRARR